ncbi:MAG: glycosyltransferase [Lachnospiraceae bacterium]|jgi:rhamnosyltransferase|nr:glycosyltransferase [Lachnospiraceae bacterium]
MGKTIDVIIPTFRPNKDLVELVSRLKKQTIKINKVIILHTISFPDPKEMLNGFSDVEVYYIDEKSFDHGTTRNYGASLSKADYMVFMTQDAMPRDTRLIENLILPMEEDTSIAGTYARQLPKEDTSIIEKYTRKFNYPNVSIKKTIKDIPTLGIKTFFFSDVCAAYRKTYFNEVGGFENHIILNEDALIASKFINAGYGTYYSAKALVYHSHNYSIMDQFHRNFDIGVSHATYPEVFSNLSSESEGIHLVIDTMRFLLRVKKPFLIFRLFFQSVAKYKGYFLGKHYKYLPKSFIQYCTLNKNFWY